MTVALKEIAGDAVPQQFRESIATEKDVATIEELKNFLNDKDRR